MFGSRGRLSARLPADAAPPPASAAPPPASAAPLARRAAHRSASIGAALFALAMFGAGCAVPIAAGLDDAQADRVVVALDHAGVAADKEADPASEGRYRISVARHDAAHAIAALQDEGLPAPDSPGLLEAFGKSSIVPSQLAEHAQYLAGLSGELERTLRSIDGVLAARVHLSVPIAEPFGDGPKTRPSASVLLKHRGATPPIGREQIQALVAGATAGLAPADVSVVMVSRPAPAATDPHLVQVGPLAVSSRSAGWAKGGFAAAVALGLALGATVLVLLGRVRRLRDALAALESERPEGARRAA